MKARLKSLQSVLALTVASVALPAIGTSTPAPVWPTFRNDTLVRLVADPSVGVNDLQEKDYAWGDVDHDGDIDLVCVRKEPFDTPGRFRNVLFMNEGVAEGHPINGVLVDRTTQYAIDATDGGQGMLDLTADRDVALVDVNGDGWLDVVTATTYGQGLPKTISHPRVYINKGSTGPGWNGFRYEEPRTPTMPIAPNFCGVGFGDVTGDQRPDLYFVDYNNTLEDRLWINNGAGFYSDQSLLRMTPIMLESDFGVHAVIADMNGDGRNDIVKDRGSTHTIPPLRISISYNNPAIPGFFSVFKIIYDGNPYHVQVGDLNGDGRLDLVVEDDVIDRYFLNQGNAADGTALFTTLNLSPVTDSFGGNIVITDVNKDGFKDIAVADVDVDCCGCTRFMRFWRNRGNVPNVTFQEQSGGIPISARTGTQDVAIFDLNGDTWPDMVIGTCTGMSIWISQPVAFAFEGGNPPTLVPPDAPTELPVQISVVGGAGLVPGGATLHASVGGGPFVSSDLLALGGDWFAASLPAAPCGVVIEYYISAAPAAGGVFTSPSDAPNTMHRAVAGAGTEVVLNDQIEGDVSGWTIVNEQPLLGGAWEQAIPVATFQGGQPAAPGQDATPDPGVRAFVTQNGLPGAAASASDVDGGPTRLLSPVINLAGAEAIVSYSAWFFSSHQGASGADFLTVELSNNGGSTWSPVASLDGTAALWQTREFIVSSFLTTTDQVRVRFSTADAVSGAASSTVEAGIDDFLVRRVTCSIPADINHDGVVNTLDLGILLSSWTIPPQTSACGGAQLCPADINGDGFVNTLDLGILLASWTL